MLLIEEMVCVKVRRFGLREYSMYEKSKLFCTIGMYSLWRNVVGEEVGKVGKVEFVIFSWRYYYFIKSIRKCEGVFFFWLL